MTLVKPFDQVEVVMLLVGVQKFEDVRVVESTEDVGFPFGEFIGRLVFG